MHVVEKNKFKKEDELNKNMAKGDEREELPDSKNCSVKGEDMMEDCDTVGCADSSLNNVT